MKLVIASTQGEGGVSLETLHSLQREAHGRRLYYEEKLWVVSDTEVVPVAFVDDDTDRDKTYILIANFAPVAEAGDTVEAGCEHCFRTGNPRPEDVTLCGLSLKRCLQDAGFTRALVTLLSAEDLGLDFWRGWGVTEAEKKRA